MGGALALTTLGAAPAQSRGPVLIRRARVFDGSGNAPRVRDVLVEGDSIAAVGRRINSPPGVRIVEGAGLTLLPGLSDLHIHTRRAAWQSPDTLAQAMAPWLAAGVTSVNEYSMWPEGIAPVRAIHRSDLPHLNLAIRLGVPHGHGTESDFTSSATTQVTSAAEARATMPRLLAYRPDVIKVFADGWRYADPDRPNRPSMDTPTLSAIVDAAHAAGVPVVTHTVTLAGAKIAATAGVDALVHGIGDALVDKEIIRLMKRGGTAYVPTMVVYEPQQDRRFLSGEWRMMPQPSRDREQARMARPVETIPEWDKRRWWLMRENLRLLHEAGVRIGAGTDTGVDGILPGVGLLRELWLYAQNGLTPAQAIEAATAGNARIMGKSRTQGRIARGYRADLVLVGGEPDKRIADLYDVRRVFVGGDEVALVPSS